MKPLIAILTCVCLVNLSSASAQQEKAQPSEEVAGSSLDAIVLSRELGQFWGQVLVAKGGRIILAKGYGLADSSLKPLDDRTIMDVGSIAKQFTAAAILKLEMVGKLSTDDPVSHFFPDAGGDSDRITLYQLLSHTSGLSDANQAIQQLNFPDRDLAVRRAMNSTRNGPPGDRFEYCNGGYVVLAAVIEVASGQSFEDYMHAELFRPANLTSTGFLGNDPRLDLSNTAARIVEAGSRPRRTTIMGDGWGWGFKGCGGVLTNVHDLLAWDRALRGNSILDETGRAKHPASPS
jgi:CubicO group peptidase (beta-lactamase class C family)